MTRAEQIRDQLEEIERKLEKARPDPERSNGYAWADNQIQMAHRDTLLEQKRALLREYDRLPSHAKPRDE